MLHLHQRPLSGDNVVWLAILVYKPGVGLDPLPTVFLCEQPKDGEAALARLYHWNHIRRSVSLLFTLCTPCSVHTLTLHLLSLACCCEGGYMLMFTLAKCTSYKSCLHTLMKSITLKHLPHLHGSVMCLALCVIVVQVMFLCCLVSKQASQATSC